MTSPTEVIDLARRGEAPPGCAVYTFWRSISAGDGRAPGG